MQSQERSRGVEAHFCMYCGVLSPPRTEDSVFIGWSCDSCGHVVCTKCVQDMKVVGKYQVDCCWWDCSSNVQIKIRVKDQFAKPIVVKPYEEYEGEVLLGHRWYVEINVKEEWQPIDVLNFRTTAEQETMPVFSASNTDRRAFAFGRSEVRAEFDMVMDDRNWDFVAQGTLVRASFNLNGKLKTMFQGFISAVPTFTIEPERISVFHVQAIEGETVDD